MTSVRRTALVIFLFLAALAAVPAAQAAGRAECRDLPSKILNRPVPYCVLLPPSYDATAKRAFLFSFTCTASAATNKR